jgi:hypothetical protein
LIVVVVGLGLDVVWVVCGWKRELRRMDCRERRTCCWERLVRCRWRER